MLPVLSQKHAKYVHEPIRKLSLKIWSPEDSKLQNAYLANASWSRFSPIIVSCTVGGGGGSRSVSHFLFRREDHTPELDLAHTIRALSRGLTDECTKSNFKSIPHTNDLALDAGCMLISASSKTSEWLLKSMSPSISELLCRGASPWSIHSPSVIWSVTNCGGQTTIWHALENLPNTS